MKKMLVITVTGDHKYTFGIDKKVSEVLQEIHEKRSFFYQVVDSCALKIDSIISVEQFEYDPKEVNDEAKNNNA